MKTLTVEWIVKAEADLLTAERESAAVDRPNYDAVAFHAQQCAEKYLKARLIEASVSFPRTHDLGRLLKLLPPVEPEWEALTGDLDALSDMAVDVRYPEASADADDAALAVSTAYRVRAIVRVSLGVADSGETGSPNDACDRDDRP